MKAWLHYFRERFPLAVYALIVGGIALSGQVIGARHVDPLAFAVSFASLLVFFAMLRLMDEYKDYDKDRIAHPERPLPRGLLTVAQAETAIRRGVVAMALWPIIVAPFWGAAAALAYWVVVAYLWLMYREFFVGEWLERRPLLYAITHQVIIFPLGFFSLFMASGDGGTTTGGLTLGLLFIGPFFAYEVCRKLDPDADPVLMTYLTVYGKAWTFAIIAAAVAVAAAAASRVDYGISLWVLQALLLLSASTIWWRPSAFKVPELVASLLLVAHLWIVPVVFWARAL